MGARVEGDEVGCTARGSVGRRLEARAGSAGPRPQVRVHGSAAHHGRGCGGEEAAAKKAAKTEESGEGETLT